jgi:7-cyano-7-deazaguanine synthase in queuosine biosynthesis
MKSIDVDSVNLDIYTGPVGVSVSGGADSAILLYHLMKNKTDDKIYIFSTGNHEKSRLNIPVATTVVEKCIHLTGNTNVEHHITYTDEQNSTSLFNKLDFYFDNNLVNIVYTGVTENPPKVVSDKFMHEVTELDREADAGIKPTIHHNKFYTPWININKLKIAEMYNKDNLLKELYPYTRSCEYNQHNSFFANIEDPGLGHCGYCWWCEERKWAFGKLQ